MSVTPDRRFVPDGNAKEGGKVMWSQSQYAPRAVQFVTSWDV